MIDNIGNFLKFYGKSCSNFLKSDGWFFFLLLILNLTIFTGNELLIEGIQYFYSGAFIIFIFSVLIYWALSNFSGVKLFFQVFISIVLTIFFVADIFLLYKFQVPLREYMIEILLVTNPNEVKEFFQAYVLNLPVIIGTAATIFLIVTAVKKLRTLFKNLSENNLHRISYHLLIVFLPAVVFSFYLAFSVVLMIAEEGTILGRNIANIYAAIENTKNETAIFVEMDSQDEKIIADNSKIPYVVFVLGESATRNHMQLYGYNLENNPLLIERYKRGELFKFNDVIACANYTQEAMEKIFTFAEKDSAEKWYTVPNLFDILRRAGYHTFWISNQTPTESYGNADKVYSARCDEYFFETFQQKNMLERFETSQPKNMFERSFDEVLLPQLDNFLVNTYEKNFYVVHLYGSHRMYDARYPKSFEKFTADDEDKPEESQRQMTAEYDNSILYSDFILDEIFKRFEDKNALIIYISDHGEEVFENGKDISTHSPEEVGSRSVIEIPMLIWTSKNFRELYPEKISAIKNSVNNPYRTDFIIHMVLDLMDIRTENFNPAKSIVNEKFDTSIQRIYNGKPYIKN